MAKRNIYVDRVKQVCHYAKLEKMAVPHSLIQQNSFDLLGYGTRCLLLRISLVVQIRRFFYLYHIQINPFYQSPSVQKDVVYPLQKGRAGLQLDIISHVFLILEILMEKVLSKSEYLLNNLIYNKNRLIPRSKVHKSPRWPSPRALRGDPPYTISWFLYKILE